uniref:Ground-like domain-containing protein n=1 Tax=Bursaphelenchus xylophilus TaxID=6326 RepID=A0A1I7RS67_BURXY
MILFLMVQRGSARDSMVMMEPPIKPSPELKSMLLENLNKHANNLDELEPLQTAKSRGSTTFTSKTTIELDDTQNRKTTTPILDPDGDLPFNVNQVSGLFDDSDLAKADVNSENIPFTPLSNIEDSFRLQPLNLNTLPPTPVLSPSQLPSFSLPGSNSNHQSILAISPISSSLLQSFPPGLAAPPALPRPSSNPGLPPGSVPSPSNSFPSFLVPPPNSNFPSLHSSNIPPLNSDPSPSSVPSSNQSNPPGFLSSTNPLSFSTFSPSSQPSFSTSQQNFSPSSPPLPSTQFPSFPSSGFPSSPPLATFPPLLPFSPSQQSSIPYSSPVTSPLVPFPSSPSSQTSWRVTDAQPGMSSSSPQPSLLSELSSNFVALNNSRPLSPLSTLPSLIPLPALQVAEEWSRNIRTTTVTPSTSSFPPLAVITSTLAPLDMREWRNRFYKTLKRINKKKKMTEKRPLRNHDAEGGNNILRNLTNDGLKAFDIEKSGYDYSKAQQGRPQTPGVQSQLQEYAFAGNRSLEALQPVSLRESKERSKNKFQKAKVQPLPYRQFQIDNDADDIETPCPAVGCNAKSHNPWIFQNDVILDNTDTCNNDKLRKLAERLIIPTDAETSKRLIQKRFEEELDRFFNVICGTGFFSYIAHTDDFCLVNVGEMNCYIFSPVCTDSQGLGAGILKVRRKKNVNNSRVR